MENNPFSETLKEEGEKEPLVHASPLTRILAALADAFMVFLLGMLIASVPAAYAFGFYDKLDKYGAQQQVLVDLSLDSHLSSLDSSGQFKEDAVLRSEYISLQLSEDKYDEHGDFKDILAYYYVTYAGHEINEYNTDILGLPASIGEPSQSPLFEYAAIDEPGVLKTDVKEAIRKYVDRESTNAEAYNALGNFFDATFKRFSEEFAETPAYRGAFDKFNAMNDELRWIGSFMAEIGFGVSSLAFLLIIPTFALKGKTIGKAILKLRVGDKYGLDIGKGVSAIRGAFLIFTDLWLLTLIPFMTWSLSALNLPLFSIGGSTLTFGLFGLIFLLYAIASFVVSLIRKDRRAIHDLLLRTYVYSSDIALIEAARRIDKAKQSGELR